MIEVFLNEKADVITGAVFIQIEKVGKMGSCRALRLKQEKFVTTLTLII